MEGRGKKYEWWEDSQMQLSMLEVLMREGETNWLEIKLHFINTRFQMSDNMYCLSVLQRTSHVAFWKMLQLILFSKLHSNSSEFQIY